MATKAEVARMVSGAVVNLLAGDVDETLTGLEHVVFDERVYGGSTENVFEVVADGETFRVVISKPRDYR